MGATILDNAEVGDDCIVGAHTLIPKGMKIPPGSLVVGTPGKVVRQLTEEELQSLIASAKGYQELGATYRGLLSNLAKPA
jgi:carbonic anhydrase/acetyltransferase-like protein (isoleucine patch superfamily)